MTHHPAKPTSPTTNHNHLLSTLALLETSRNTLVSKLLPHFPLPDSPTSITETEAVSPTSPPILIPTCRTETEAQAPSNEKSILTHIHLQAQKTNQTHIRLLHAYNEIRDVAHGLVGLIAEQRGVRVVDVMEEFGVAGDD